MAKILIVEDELAIADLIRMNLSLTGHESTHVDSGAYVMDAISRDKPDLIILDVLLPGMDGFTLMEKIEPLGIPVIFLTAKHDLADRIRGLKLGADDYIAKPFETIELLTRIDTVLRRVQKASSPVVTLGNLEIRLDEHTVLMDGQPVDLTAKEFQLLEVLLRNQNIALTRERLLEMVWGFEYLGETRTVDVHIQRLRKKLCLEEKIKTIHRVGYRLEASP